ncbi:MAG: NADH-quinone oxidoreductase subunit NuoF [Pseudomonadales bacterium]|nr:NADH-quinone oxidoreductase subunit NuoF [Pseudomonadales bacterium]
METPLTQNIGPGKLPLNLQEYRAAGGYRAAHKALLEMESKDILQLLQDANLRGRGGAGFPTGMKWSFVPMYKDREERPKYLVINADEMEPGTFKDRLLMEGDPHQLIEGIIISAYTLQAEVAYIFIRGEYQRSADLLNQAITECKAQGLLGTNIMHSRFNLDIFVHTSAGRYICGEETALLNSLEGKRATPRAKPPFPQVSGLWGRPTVVNNVETICNVPHIVNKGAAWYKSLSLTEDAGTKIFGVSGRVRNPGAWELPMGTPVREIIENYAGGMQDGYKLRGFLPGGGSTNFLTQEHLDLHMDYTSIGKAGSRLGTGTMIILDDKTCPVGMVRNLEHFFAQESCGWCTPCRDGLPWVEHILTEFEHGRGEIEDMEVLTRHTHLLGPGNTFCAHAPGAMGPLESALRYFREDFEAHIHSKSCPWTGIRGSHK